MVDIIEEDVVSAVLKKELDHEESVKSLTVLYCFPGTIAFSPLEKAFCPFKFFTT